MGSLFPPFLLKCKVLNIEINFRDAKLFKIPKLLITKTKEEEMTRATVKHISEKLNWVVNFTLLISKLANGWKTNYEKCELKRISKQIENKSSHIS